MLMFVFYLMKNPLLNILSYNYHLLDEVFSESYKRWDFGRWQIEKNTFPPRCLIFYIVEIVGLYRLLATW